MLVGLFSSSVFTCKDASKYSLYACTAAPCGISPRVEFGSNLKGPVNP